MTIPEFLDRLSLVVPVFTWTLDRGAIRGHSGRIGGACFCPITATARSQGLDRAAAVGQSLGLTWNDALAVMRAADDHHTHDQVLRNELLTRCGLVPA